MSSTPLSPPRLADGEPSLARNLLNKVPEVTVFFWIIKVLCTTVGETAADYVNTTLGLGLTNTTYLAAALLATLLFAQFRLRCYVPGVYWAVVVVFSVFGTLITDNLTDMQNVALTVTTPLFAAILAFCSLPGTALEPPTSRQPAREDDVRDRGASRRGDEPQVLEILARAPANQLIVWREHRTQRVQRVLTSLLPSPALAQRTGDLKYACDDPAVLVGLIKCDREVDRSRHEQHGSARRGRSGVAVRS